MTTNQPETEEIQPAAISKGLLTTFGVSFYPQELDYVDHYAAIYGLSRSAAVRNLINQARMADQAARTN